MAFSPADRVRRLTEICSRGGQIGVDDLQRLLQDVYSEKALELRDQLLTAVPVDCRASVLHSALASWDGRYDPESVGALAYELVLSGSRRRCRPITEPPLARSGPAVLCSLPV